MQSPGWLFQSKTFREVHPFQPVKQKHDRARDVSAQIMQTERTNPAVLLLVSAEQKDERTDSRKTATSRFSIRWKQSRFKVNGVALDGGEADRENAKAKGTE